MIEAVIFDGDGVVFDSEELSLRAFSRTLSRFGIYQAAEDLTRFVGIGNEEIARMITRETGASIDPAEFASLKDEDYVALALAEGAPRRMAGINDLFTALAARGIPCGLASSGSERKVAHNLAATQLEGFFLAVVHGNEVARSKPAPDIFLEAAARLQASPARCLVLEDSCHGLDAARAAGCRPVGLVGTFEEHVLCHHCEQVIARPHELLAILDTIRYGAQGAANRSASR